MIEKRFVAPALPLPPREYDSLSATDQIRVLRLYFNLLDNYFSNTILDALNGGVGGNGITFPHIAASDSTDQRTTNDTPTVVNWNTLDSGYLWTLNSPGSATADVAGVYTIRYSLQFANTDNQQHTATVWLQKNGSDVANSSTSFSVPARKSASIPGFVCGYSEATFTVAVGDEIELYWAVDKANVVSPAADGIYMFHDAAWTTPTNPYARPAIPSAIGSISYVSAIPPA
jgi:plastocyanin